MVHIFEQKVQMMTNSNGHVQKAFKVVKGTNSQVVQVEGKTNKDNSSLYHILQTIRKNNAVMKQYYKIHEKDLYHLFHEGERLSDYKKLTSKKKKSLKKKSKSKEKVKKIKKSIKSRK